jgi:hypothetical protein
MVDTPRKTVPELQALSAPIVDTDLIVVYRSPGPLRKISAATLAASKMNTSMSNVDAAIGSVSVNPVYSGTGTATSGTPRMYFGTLTPIGDDSAICIGRNVIGNLLFSHAFRDESDFLSTGDSAYTSFDAFTQYKSNSSLKYNHGYGYQWRSRMAATNGMDLFSGFLTFPIVSAGTVDRLFHFHVQGQTISGTGAVTLQAGLYINPLAGAAANYGIYQQGSSNPNFFAGATQFGSSVNAHDVTANAALTSFPVGGGAAMVGTQGASAYAGVQAYDAGGAGGTKGLALNGAGGQVLVNALTPVLGTSFEVVGSVGMNSARCTGEYRGGSLNATGAIEAFYASGGVAIAGASGASGYATIRSYNDATGAGRGLSINPLGTGQVLVGAASPYTGETLEVVGTIGTDTSYRVDGIKVVGNQGAAVADATDAASVIARLNDLLSRLRTHGLIAT